MSQLQVIQAVPAGERLKHHTSIVDPTIERWLQS